jgi:hypothetical protein
MDTYVHMAVGAAVGDATALLLERKVFKKDLINTKQQLQGKQERLQFGVVTETSLLAGLVSHILTDALPHSDILVKHGLLIPNRLWPLREFLACVAILVLLFVGARGRRCWLLLAAAVMGGLPDLESLAMGVGLMNRANAIFPTHNGMIPHGQDLDLPSLIIELGSLFSSLLWIFRKIGKKSGQ